MGTAAGSSSVVTASSPLRRYLIAVMPLGRRSAVPSWAGRSISSAPSGRTGGESSGWAAWRTAGGSAACGGVRSGRSSKRSSKRSSRRRSRRTSGRSPWDVSPMHPLTALQTAMELPLAYLSPVRRTKKRLLCATFSILKWTLSSMVSPKRSKMISFRAAFTWLTAFTFTRLALRGGRSGV